MFRTRLLSVLPYFLSASLFAASAAMADSPVSASALLGARVTDASGASLGHIDDLAIDVTHGAVAYAIVRFDGPAAQDVGLRSVPFDTLRGGLARDQVVLGGAAGVPSWTSEPPPLSPGTRVERLTRLLGLAVDHPSGADYGRIVDLVVDFPGGDARHFLVRLAHPAGPDARVPFSALRFPPGAGAALVTLRSPG